jgi:formylglycine-generating enzyme required for sulfatase activity
MWPPPLGTGNYCGEEAKIGNEPEGLIVIEDYYDGYPRTSPVGSFPANKYGLYDMVGNVWQYCENWYNPEKVFRVLRGASWYDSDPKRILASFRRLHTPDRRGADAGFRCVLAGEAPR